MAIVEGDSAAAQAAAVRAWFDRHGWQLQPTELRHALQERDAGDDLTVELIDEGADRRRAHAAAAPDDTRRPPSNGTAAGPPVREPDRGAPGPVPPQNLEAEESVLGAALISPTAIAACRRVISDDGREFYRESHARIWQTVVALTNRSEPVDAITVTNDLHERGHLDQAGGRVRLHELAALVPATANAAHYARIVHETAILRGAIRAGGEIARYGWERPGSVDELLDEARRVLTELEQAANAGRERIQIRTSTDFLSTVTDTVDVLLGAGKDRVLPAHGFGLVYGKGAAGKTTLMLTCIASLCSATPWLGIPVPRPIRILMIENEGPKAPFIEKIKEFAGQWDGPDFQPNLSFYEEPWGRFSLSDRGMRDDLLAHTRDQHIDLVVAGPLRGLGIDGPGAPSETDAFLGLLKQAGLGTELAWWIVHHTNKMGQISGDWDRQPDLLLRLTYEGKRRQRLAFEKVRWGDQGREPLVLEWLDEGVGYRILDTTPEEIDWEALRDQIASIVDDRPGCTQNDLFEAIGGRRGYIGKAVSQLIETGRIHDQGSGKKGAPRRLHTTDGTHQESLADEEHPW